MRHLLLTILIILSLNVSAQEAYVNSNIFVRVYDLQGKKIAKGKIFTISETQLQLRIGSGQKFVKVPVNDIGHIKTKRSAGNNMLIGVASGAVFGAILGSTNPPTDSSGGTFTWAGGSSADEFTSGLAVGVISGTIVGSVSILFKNSKTYNIDGNSENWGRFLEALKLKVKSDTSDL
jgi:hypothetical protein